MNNDPFFQSKAGDPLPTNHPSLPGALGSQEPPVLAPFSAGSAPAFWNDASKVIADVLELYSTNPTAAAEMWAWVKTKLNR